MALAKGSTVRSTMAFVRAERDEAALERVLARLSESDRRLLAEAGATDEVPLESLLALWRAADEELRATAPDWVERAGAFSIESTGQSMYGGIVRKATPTEFLTQGVSLFRLYYQPGNMEVVEAEASRAVLRLVGFGAADPLFCRRQTGGLHQALTLAGGGRPSTRHVRCVAEGDAFCEWELAWG